MTSKTSCGSSQPGARVKVLVKRAGTYKEETVTVTLGANKVEDWQYAGVGLSGADT